MPLPMGKNKKPNQKMKTPKFSNLILTSLLILMVITALYSVVSQETKKVEDISISELAKKLEVGEVKKIQVAGEKLSVELSDGSLRKAKKEREASLSESFSNLGVSPDKLAQTEIVIESESGFGFFLLNILPFAIPIIFILLFFWFKYSPVLQKQINQLHGINFSI